MTTAQPRRLPTRVAVVPDVPAFDARELDTSTRTALAELLLSTADDEFVLGFWDSEWTGIAPMLEEDVAFSSLAQDELGHARVLYEMLAALTADSADRIAFGREPQEYRHCRLLDHPRTDWAYSVARRYLYDTADSIRLAALARSSFAPLREVIAKIRREETYHLLHMDTWLRRLAEGGSEPRRRLTAALEQLSDDAGSVFTPLEGEPVLLDAAVMAEPMAALRERWLHHLEPAFAALDLPMPRATVPVDGRSRHGPAFEWLWGEFTAVYRLEEGATW